MSAFLKGNLFLIYILLIIGFITGGLTSFIGLIYAYLLQDVIKRPLDYQKMQKQIKIIWILFILSLFPFIILFILYPDIILNMIIA